jgi:hypothetical protein
VRYLSIFFEIKDLDRTNLSPQKCGGHKTATTEAKIQEEEVRSVDALAASASNFGRWVC